MMPRTCKVVAAAVTLLATTALADPVAAPAAPISPLVDLVKALAWPAAALLIAQLFHRPLTVFLGAIGGRITKLSVFKVELELVQARSATATPLLDEIRSGAVAAPIADSSRAMQQQLQSTAPADYAVIALGEGDAWLTSRLYIAAVMMQRMRGVQVFVFVERAALVERRLLAVASVGQVRWALAQRYPWLETAWVRANLLAFPSSPPPEALLPGGGWPSLPAGGQWLPDPRALSPGTVASDTGGFEPWQASQIVTNFIMSLQQPSTPVPPQESREWVPLDPSKYERANWVTRKLLTDLLPPSAFEPWTNRLRDAPRDQRTRAVLRRVADFVALTEGDREFVRLANRRALLEDIAAALGEEPESGTG